jgi:hypothetical protein
MPGKSQNYQKLVKDASNIASCYGSHIDVSVKQIDLGWRGHKINIKFYKDMLNL